MRGTNSAGVIEGGVRVWLLRWGTASVHPVATWMPPRMKHSQSPLAVCSSAGLLEHWTRVGGGGFYTAVGESWKCDLEAQCRCGQQRLSHGKSRRPCIILYLQITSPWILLRIRKRSRRRRGLPHMGRGVVPFQTSPQVFEHFLAPVNPGR